MMPRLTVITTAIVASTLFNTSVQAQSRGPIVIPPQLKEERFAIVRLKTSIGRCVYIQPTGLHRAMQRNFCNSNDTSLHFRFSSPVPGMIVLRHVDTGLCLSLDPNDSSKLAGVPCSGIPALQVEGTTFSPGPFKMRFSYPSGGTIPPQYCFGRSSTGLNMRAYNCSDLSLLSLRNFSFWYV